MTPLVTTFVGAAACLWDVTPLLVTHLIVVRVLGLAAYVVDGKDSRCLP